MTEETLQAFELPLANLIVEVYDGGFDDSGNYSGRGEMKMKNGVQYEGFFASGLFHGEGKITWPNSVEYTGTFMEGSITGKGTFKWPEGSVYSGDVLNGKRNGFGLFKCSGGQLYEGEWKNGLRHGKGTSSYCEGKSTTVYTGFWENGLRHGYGTMQYASGNIYEGYWFEDKKKGMGVMKWKDEISTYAGEWSNDLPNGKGEILWGNLGFSKLMTKQMSSTYRGECKDGEKSGVGSFIYADGSQYTGEWYMDTKHGKGVAVLGNGTVEATTFQLGQNVKDKSTNATAFPATTTEVSKEVKKKKSLNISPAPMDKKSILADQGDKSGNKDMKLHLLDILQALPQVNTPNGNNADDGDLYNKPKVFLNVPPGRDGSSFSFSDVQEEIERICLRYNGILKKTYFNLMNSSTWDSRTSSLVEMIKGDKEAEEKFSEIEKAIATSIIDHQKFQSASLSSLKKLVREVELIGRDFSFYDMNACLVAMQANRKSLADNSFIEGRLTAGDLSDIVAAVGQENAQDPLGQSEIKAPALENIVGGSVGPTSLKENEQFEKPLSEWDFYNLLLRCYIVSAYRKGLYTSVQEKLEGQYGSSENPATTLSSFPMDIMDITRQSFDALFSKVQKNDIPSFLEAISSLEVQAVLREQKGFFKNLWKQILDSAAKDGISEYCGDDSVAQMRHVVRFFMNMKETCFATDTTTNNFIEILNDKELSKKKEEVVEVPVESTEGEEGEAAEAAADAEAAPEEGKETEVVEESTELVSTIPLASLIPTYSILNNLVNYEDFCEIFCKVIASDIWTYQKPVPATVETEETVDGEETPASEEAAIKAVDESKSTEAEGEVEGKGDAETGGEAEIKIPLTMRELMLERLVLFSENFE
jgi:hypothetical protein